MNTEARNEDPEEGAVKIAEYGERTAKRRLSLREAGRRGPAPNWTIKVIALISCLTLAGTVSAKISDPIPEVDAPVIQTAALQTDLGVDSDQTGTAGAAVMDLTPQASASAEGGPAILWVVALALMAVLWLGRRNDGGV